MNIIDLLNCTKLLRNRSPEGVDGFEVRHENPAINAYLKKAVPDTAAQKDFMVGFYAVCLELAAEQVVSASDSRIVYIGRDDDSSASCVNALVKGSRAAMVLASLGNRVMAPVETDDEPAPASLAGALARPEHCGAPASLLVVDAGLSWRDILFQLMAIASYVMPSSRIILGGAPKEVDHCQAALESLFGKPAPSQLTLFVTPDWQFFLVDDWWSPDAFIDIGRKRRAISGAQTNVAMPLGTVGQEDWWQRDLRVATLTGDGSDIDHYRYVLVNQNAMVHFDRSFLVITEDGRFLRETFTQSFVVRNTKRFNEDAQGRLVYNGHPRPVTRVVYDPVFLLPFSISPHSHWVTQGWPCLQLLKALPFKVKVAVGEDIEGYKLPMLKAAGYGEDDLIRIKRGETFLARTAIVAEDIISCRYPHWISDFYDNLVVRMQSRTKRDDRIYISRRADFARRHRRLLNEADVEDLFHSYGFDILLSENLGFEVQVDRFGNAAVIAGPTGAGLYNMVYRNQPATILDFHADTYTDFRNICRLADIMGHRHIRLPCVSLDTKPAGTVRGLQDSSFIADLEQLDAAIRYAIGETGDAGASWLCDRHADAFAGLDHRFAKNPENDSTKAILS